MAKYKHQHVEKRQTNTMNIMKRETMYKQKKIGEKHHMQGSRKRKHNFQRIIEHRRVTL